MAKRASRRSRSSGSAAAGDRMRYYLIQYSYTPEAWRSLLERPRTRDRRQAVESLIASLGGCLATVGFKCDPHRTDGGKFVAFGTYDVVVLAAFPDNRQAAAFSMAISAGGSVKSFHTTPLMSFEEGMAAMAEAAAKRTGYRSLTAPGRS